MNAINIGYLGYADIQILQKSINTFAIGAKKSVMCHIRRMGKGRFA
jgi:hypothetical protein